LCASANKRSFSVSFSSNFLFISSFSLASMIGAFLAASNASTCKRAFSANKRAFSASVSSSFLFISSITCELESNSLFLASYILCASVSKRSFSASCFPSFLFISSFNFASSIGAFLVASSASTCKSAFSASFSSNFCFISSIALKLVSSLFFFTSRI